MYIYIYIHTYTHTCIYIHTHMHRQTVSGARQWFKSYRKLGGIVVQFASPYLSF